MVGKGGLERYHIYIGNDNSLMSYWAEQIISLHLFVKHMQKHSIGLKHGE